MNDLARTITIVGAGGIGCALGYALRAGGVDVTFVDADADKIRSGREHGVRVDEKPALPATFVEFDDWSPRPDDLLFLCTKCYDNAAVLERVPADIPIVPVQNGFDPRLVERVEIEGIASFVSECEPGTPHTRITRPGELHIGFRDDANGRELPAALSALVNVLKRHGDFPVLRVPAVLPYKNTKLMYNAAISPIAALAGLDNGELLTLPRARKIFFALILENYRILSGAGAPLAKIGPFHPDTVSRILHVPLLPFFMSFSFVKSLRGTYCSMAGEIQKGRTEIDNYNGHLLAVAGSRSFPLNRAVHDLVKRMEAERAAPSIDRLDELSAAIGGAR